MSNQGRKLNKVRKGGTQIGAYKAKIEETLIEAYRSKRKVNNLCKTSQTDVEISKKE